MSPKAFGQFFNQDFNSSTTLGDYTSATPNAGQFNNIVVTGTNGVSAASGNLTFTRGNGTGYFVRTTNFSPTPVFISYSFDLSTSSGANTDNVARFYIGSGFTNDVNEQAAFGRFRIDFRNTNNFRVTMLDGGGTSSANFAGLQRVTWIINKSGCDRSYTSPSGTTETVAADRMDLWIGTTQVLNEMAAQTPAQQLNNLKFRFFGGSGTIVIDNISLQNLPIATTPLPPGTYEINAAGTNTLGGGETVYTSLTGNCGLFSQINTHGLAGSITVRITSNLTETGANGLNEWAGTHTLTIVPNAANLLVAGNANPLINFNGADRVTIDGSNGGALTGAARLTFRQTGNNATLQFVNDATQYSIGNCIFESNSNNGTLSDPFPGSTFYFGGGVATGNDNISVSNCVLRNRTDAGGTPRLAINSTGTSTTIQNNRLWFDNCEFINFFTNRNGASYIALVQGNTANFRLTNSHVYQTFNYDIGTSAVYNRLITLGNAGVDTVVIEDNFIGGRAINAGGGNYVHQSTNPGQRFGWEVLVSSMAPNARLSFQRNTIRNIRSEFGEGVAGSNSRWVGFTGSGRAIVKDNVFSNLRFSVSSNTGGNGLCGVQCINYAGSAQGEVTGNTMNDIQLSFTDRTISGTFTPVAFGFDFIGIRLAPSNANLQVSLNVVGSPSLANTIASAAHGSRNSMVGINLASANTTVVFDNQVANLTNNTTNPSSLLYGLAQTANGNTTLTANRIYSLNSFAQQPINANNVTVAGLHFNSSATNTVTFNQVYALASGATTSSVAAGIVLAGATNGQIRNNLVYNIRNTGGGTTPVAAGVLARNSSNALYIFNNMITLGVGSTDDTHYLGVWNNLTTPDPVKFWYNTVYVGGDGTGTTLPSFGYLRGDFDAATDFAALPQLINNIFYNVRAGGTGPHFAIGNQEASPWANGALCGPADLPDYNAYYALDNTALGYWGPDGASANKTFATWRPAAGNPDQNSFELPLMLNFADPAIGDLHVTPNSNFAQTVDGKGNPIHQVLGYPISVDYDYDNDFRRSPDLGADEVENTLQAVAGGGDWHNPATWVQNIVPNCGDLVEIPAGVTVTIKTPGTSVVGINSSITPDSIGNVARFYRLTIKTGAKLVVENGAKIENCWLNGIAASSINFGQPHSGGFIIEPGAFFETASPTSTYRFSLAGDFIDNGTFQKGNGTVELNLDRTKVNSCLADYIEWYNRSFSESDLGGTSHTNFHNLTILRHSNTLTVPTPGGTDSPAASTTILGANKIIRVGDAATDQGVLNIQGPTLGLGSRLNLNGNTLVIEGTLASNGHTSLHPNVANLPTPPADMGTLGTISGQGGKLYIFGRGDLTGHLKFTLNSYPTVPAITPTLPVITNGQDFRVLNLRRHTSGLATLGNGQINVADTLKLTAGRVRTGPNTTDFEVNVTNDDPNLAVISHKTSTYTDATATWDTAPAAWVWGYLRRAVRNAVHTYDYPLGDQNRYELARMEITSPFGASTQNVRGFFDPTNASGTVGETCAGFNYLICEGGFWNLTPNAAISGSYNVQLFPVGFNCLPGNGCPEPITIAKGPAWSFAGSAYASTYKRSGFTGFSPFVPVYNDYNLVLTPVEFISFTATAVGQGVRLDWATAWERNAAHFVVQRSADGQDWQPLGQVKALGQANSRTNYSFVDAHPLAGLNYYRLAQVDHDQATQFTRIVSLDFAREADLAFRLYPNPSTNGRFELLLPNENGQVELSIMDAAGRTLHQQVHAQAGAVLQVVPSTELVKGVYTVRVVRAGRAWVGKLVVQ